jgi:hypothetical protein
METVLGEHGVLLRALDGMDAIGGSAAAGIRAEVPALWRALD